MVPLRTEKSPPTRRVGPLERMDRGQYKGQEIDSLIRRNPSYMMYCIKEWLDISPIQALLFEEVTGGGIIPDRYIKEVPPRVETYEDNPYYYANRDIVPNWDFDPSAAPSWWREFKERARDLSPKEYIQEYEKLQRRDLQNTIREFYVKVSHKE